MTRPPMPLTARQIDALGATPLQMAYDASGRFFGRSGHYFDARDVQPLLERALIMRDPADEDAYIRTPAGDALLTSSNGGHGHD